MGRHSLPSASGLTTGCSTRWSHPSISKRGSGRCNTRPGDRGRQRQKWLSNSAGSKLYLNPICSRLFKRRLPAVKRRLVGRLRPQARSWNMILRPTSTLSGQIHFNPNHDMTFYPFVLLSCTEFCPGNRIMSFVLLSFRSSFPGNCLLSFVFLSVDKRTKGQKDRMDITKYKLTYLDDPGEPFNTRYASLKRHLAPSIGFPGSRAVDGAYHHAHGHGSQGPRKRPVPQMITLQSV